jgi:alpha-mannosidase
MDDSISHLLTLKAEARGYWAERIVAELEYAVKLTRSTGRGHDAVLRAAIESLASTWASSGAITRETAEETEGKLQALSAEAKSLTVLCAAHAHIDMNWMWRFDETVAITLDTFRTMLTLLTEYPGFTFSQSQASVYRIVEEHDPEMLKEIRKRVKEGRWEVTASTWVEADKNMPNGESFARHALYAKRSLARLLDIAPESLQLDFEPDTFGHSRNVPEILSRAGVRWYYHCRGFDEQVLYRWQAPSGAQVIVFRDPFWYNSEVTPGIAAYVPEFCKATGMDTYLRVYGVGDHGGGPTRRDIERLIDMDSWPLFPRVRFGTYREFFGKAEKVADKLPLVNKELNAVFTGCYTTQARIKAANRLSENRLVEAETFSALAALAVSSPYRSAHLTRAWEATLFNHFHDIIPGSGTVDTREYALGQFQQVMAAATTEASLALRRIAGHVDTSALGDPREDARATISEGAGAAYGIADFRLSAVERGRGRTRIYHVFNPLPWQRSAVVEAVVWDWPGDAARVRVTDAAGAELPHQVMPAEVTPVLGVTSYWGHTFVRLAVAVTVPACGYATFSVSEATPKALVDRFMPEPRVERLADLVLENELVRAVFHPTTAALVSFVDKASGEELIDSTREGGIFRLVQEDDSRGMTAWIVGRWMSCRSAHDSVKITPVAGTDGLRQWLRYEAVFGSSRLKATVTLDKGSSSLAWDVECEWLEIGRRGQGVPQLNFFLPLAADTRAYRYDVPFGVVDRPPQDMDLPANGWVLAVPRKASKKALQLVADQKHGFRGVDNSLSLTLLRSSWEPDPHPELGVHRFSFAAGPVEYASPGSLIAAAQSRAHPLACVSGTAHAGSLPLSLSFLSVDGAVGFSAVKMPEDDPAGRLVVRLYETEGKQQNATLHLFCTPADAWCVDLNEHKLPDAPKPVLAKDTVTVALAPYTVVTVVVQFAGCRG